MEVVGSAVVGHVVKDNGLAVRGGLAQADGALDDRVEHQVLEVLAQLHHHLAVHLRAAVEHRHDEALDGEAGVDVVLHQADGLEQLRQAFQGEELRLDRNHHGVRRREAVDGDEAQGRGAVDDDVVVAVPDGRQGLLEVGLAVRPLDHLDFRAHEVDVGGNHVEVLQLRLDEGVLRGDVPPDDLIQGAFLVVVRGEVQAGGRVGLRVRVDDEHFLLQDREGCGQVDGRRGLAHAAFLVRYGDDFSHIR